MANKKQKAREYLAATHGDDRGGFALKAAADYGRAKAQKTSPSPSKASPAGSTPPKAKRSGAAVSGRTRRPEKDDVATPEKPTAFSSGPSTRGGTRKAKTSTGPSTRGGARKSSAGTAGGGSSSRDGKRPEEGFVKKIRRKIRSGLGLGKSDGFSLDIKKYQKK